MKEHKIISFDSLGSNLKAAITSSLTDLTQSNISADQWAQTSLKRNIENSIKSQNFNSTTKTFGPGDPPGSGFSVMLGLNITIGYKIKFRTNLDIGYGQRWGNVSGNTSLHMSAYNGGLGTYLDSNNLVFDITAAASVTVGNKKGTPLQSYTLNYYSPTPMLNNFKNSLTYGQMLTWNSALNENKLSLDNLQRTGIFGFRIGDFNISSANDTLKKPYFGCGSDKGWTGQLTIATPLMEFGFQDFTGDFEDGGLELSRYKLLEELNTYETLLSKSKKTILAKAISRPSSGKTVIIQEAKRQIKELKSKISTVKTELSKITRTKTKHHTQTDYQKNLNKASTYFRFKNANGQNLTIDLIGPGWMQDGIHWGSRNHKFDYNYYETQVTVGMTMDRMPHIKSPF